MSFWKTILDPRVLIGVLISVLMYSGIYYVIGLIIYKADTKAKDKATEILNTFAKEEAITLHKEIKDGKIHVDINCTSCYYKLLTR